MMVLVLVVLLDEVTLTMTDSYGDGWNGGTLTINGVTYDQPTTGPAMVVLLILTLYVLIYQLV